jgi:hypothetical protein
MGEQAVVAYFKVQSQHSFLTGDPRLKFSRSPVSSLRLETCDFSVLYFVAKSSVIWRETGELRKQFLTRVSIKQANLTCSSWPCLEFIPQLDYFCSFMKHLLCRSCLIVISKLILFLSKIMTLHIIKLLPASFFPVSVRAQVFIRLWLYGSLLNFLFFCNFGLNCFLHQQILPKRGWFDSR